MLTWARYCWKYAVLKRGRSEAGLAATSASIGELKWLLVYQTPAGCQKNSRSGRVSVDAADGIGACRTALMQGFSGPTATMAITYAGCCCLAAELQCLSYEKPAAVHTCVLVDGQRRCSVGLCGGLGYVAHDVKGLQHVIVLVHQVVAAHNTTSKAE